jgi:hypothetical protein
VTTIAERIVLQSKNASEAIKAADALTDNVNQDWGNETSSWLFEDGSVLVVSGPEMRWESGHENL